MSLRKPHSKSRFGCLPCKKRHIKCGEETPICRNCINRRVTCIYGLPRASSPRHASRATSSKDTCHTQCEQNNGMELPLTCRCGQDSMTQCAIPTTKLQELQLMVYYTTTTYETMANSLEDIEIWRKVVPKEAVQHDFLMDELLALSSLHFASQNPGSRWQFAEIAIQYQTSALRKYASALEHVTKDNCDALFICSILITILALAFPNVALMIVRLRERTDSIAESVDPERRQAYLSGIEALKTAFGLMKASTHLGPVIAWPAMVNEKLLKLFKQSDPIAQFIFIHYGVLLLYTRDRWWGRDIGVSLIESLACSLYATDPEWATWTEWARETAALAIQEDRRS
ncbi:hypothetical protein B0J11DRAFT_498101 [Dendryphion nanum]|uniref:Zn(2)-C6 fungal-type domain-containing protein n=1 Tax=Dendryphion nanum TaxID=256645 RepID=A0A9P9IA61_9PLEO|nr:hypothetical protein B0J11DRAFT_498101 [Dendryphion nanum]